MDREILVRLLQSYRAGKVSLRQVLNKLRVLPYENQHFARIDFHRALRKGFPEVVFGPGKTAEQLALTFERLAHFHQVVLATKVKPDQAQAVTERVKGARYFKEANLVLLDRRKRKKQQGKVVVISAGTADIPVAEEAALTAHACGAKVERIFDIGVAGLHRLIDVLPQLEEAQAIVIVAGMEGALPSVVSGLVSPPIIAVPTSIGYGSHQGGFVPLMTMLNTCAPGVAVVNIDNGFGAGYFAALVAQK